MHQFHCDQNNVVNMVVFIQIYNLGSVMLLLTLKGQNETNKGLLFPDDDHILY